MPTAAQIQEAVDGIGHLHHVSKPVTDSVSDVSSIHGPANEPRAKRRCTQRGGGPEPEEEAVAQQSKSGYPSHRHAGLTHAPRRRYAWA